MRAGRVAHLAQVVATFATVIPTLVPCHEQRFFPVSETALLARRSVETRLEGLQRHQLAHRGTVDMAAIIRRMGEIEKTEKIGR